MIVENGKLDLGVDSGVHYLCYILKGWVVELAEAVSGQFSVTLTSQEKAKSPDGK